jgi:hypothetical protein
MDKELPWLRLYSRTIDNEKLGILAPSDRWYYVALLCCKAQGILDSDDSFEMLQRKLCLKLQLTLKELHDLSARLQEVTLVTAALQPVGWNEKQYVTDNPTYNADKQRRYRKRYQALRNDNVTVTTPDTDTDTDTDTDIKPKSVCTKPPGLPRASGVDFERFWEHWPKKINKLEAKKAWLSKKFELTDVDELIADVQERVKRDKTWKDGFIPHCSTYLRGERWEDDFVN